MARHDGSYKLFFSHPRMVEDLVRGFVHARWVTELDFASLEKMGTQGVSDHLQRRESDVVWRVRWGSGECSRFLYLVIELQSNPDRFMALRLQTYVALLHQDLVRRNQLTDDRKLPPVLPMVLYNGARRWSAPRGVAGLIANAPQDLQLYVPSLSYFLIDEMALPRNALPGAGNLVGTLIRLERSRRTDELLELAGQLERELRAPELSELRRHFATWINNVWATSRFPGAAIPVVTDFEEAWSMLEQRVAQWTREWERQGRKKGRKQGLREGRQQGRQQGRQKGEAIIVRRQLTRRFGTLPRQVIERIEKAPPEQLECWSDRLLDAETLDEVFESSELLARRTPLPKPVARATHEGG